MRDLRHATDLAKALRSAATLIVAAPPSALAAGWHRTVLGEGLGQRLDALAADQTPGPLGTTVTSLTSDQPRCLALALLPDRGSRHNSPTRVESLLSCLRSFRYPPGDAVIVVQADAPDHLRGVLAGIWRCHPLYLRKTGAEARSKAALSIWVGDAAGKRIPPDLLAKETMEAGRWAARTPLSLLFSRDEGATWPARLDVESGPGEFSYPAVITTGGSGAGLALCYTWNRRRIAYWSLPAIPERLEALRIADA